MPTTRRSSSSGAAAAAAGKQSTLSFNHRVTKSGAGKQTAKAAALSNAGSAAPVKPSPLAKHVSSVVDDAEPADEEVEEESKVGEDVVQIQPEGAEVTKQKEEEGEEGEEKAEPSPATEAEVKALKITQRQVETYWRGLEAERIAKRVHQEDLGTSEKVLRYFDVSSQYGPCIGITRLKRWQRADRLGLNPPIEVLSVLLREEKKLSSSNSSSKKGDSSSGSSKDKIRLQTAHMDEILNSTAVGAS
ncbi:DNA polymerase delta, subunit 4-domain-containing protein [Microdochium bolleyi]|uniref:DNA polymerase delta, subunit 4-domain-containing protein n=1 Tax=Microdochium bolleyi TaxID=196109 RepID=A0A136JH00_9PEZI|nr:DNA polymerase delta, subunit 4-domain-containing protein [Microdochium bolleyi]